MASSPVDILIDPVKQNFCRRPTNKVQRRICRKSPHLLRDATRGAEMAMAECARMFSGEKWNCVTVTPKQKRNIVQILNMGEC